MKNNRESIDVDPLLNAVFADDTWQKWNSSLKRQALTELGTARRRRQMRNWLARAACAAVLLVGLGRWMHTPAPIPSPVARSLTPPAPPTSGTQFITEEQMLAMFPPESCVVAEINGQKALVFFDAKKAEEGFVLEHQ